MGVTLMKKQLRDGRASLYLDCCMDGKRKRKALGIVLDKPNTKENRIGNREKLKVAQQIRIKHEIRCIRGGYDELAGEEFTPNLAEQTSDFFEVAHTFLQHYKRKDIRVVRAMIAHLRRFHPEDELAFSKLTRTFCTEFLHYLYTELNGNAPVCYFKRFRACLDYCVDEHLLRENPAHRLRLTEREEMTKEILTEEEISRLSVTPCKHADVKYAFLLSCYCGLRWCDIIRLRYGQIDTGRRMLTLVQQKVATHSKHAQLQLNLSNSALRLILRNNDEHDPEDPVFCLPSYSYMLRVLKEWTTQAGIRKHISYHCARHTFISNIMAKGASLKTAAVLAGHSTTRHTEKYIHTLDEQKQRAVDSLADLPDICFEPNSDK